MLRVKGCSMQTWGSFRHDHPPQLHPTTCWCQRRRVPPDGLSWGLPPHRPPLPGGPQRQPPIHRGDLACIRSAGYMITPNREGPCTSTSIQIPDTATSKDADATSKTTAHSEHNWPKTKDHKSKCNHGDWCRHFRDWERDKGHDRSSKCDHDHRHSHTVHREHGHKCECSPGGKPSSKEPSLEEPCITSSTHSPHSKKSSWHCSRSRSHTRGCGGSTDCHLDTHWTMMYIYSLFTYTSTNLSISC